MSGRADMRSVETTIQRLISRGLNPQLENNPYLCFVYTSFQERATKLSHGATARLALEHGSPQLADLCGKIAADEARHEEAYKRIVGEIMKRDPDGALLAFEDMMRKGILMPAHYMDDGQHAVENGGRSLFDDYAAVAQRMGVYTAQDYASIVSHLVQRWGVAELEGLSGNAARSQEYLVKHAARMEKLAEAAEERRERAARKGRRREPTRATFGWIRGKEVPLLG